METLRCPHRVVGLGGSGQEWIPTVGKASLGSSELSRSLAAVCPLQPPASSPASWPPQTQQKRHSRQSSSHTAGRITEPSRLRLLEASPAASTFSLVLLSWQDALPLLFTRRVQAFQACCPRTRSSHPCRTAGRRAGDHPSAHPLRSLPGGDGIEQ